MPSYPTVPVTTIKALILISNRPSVDSLTLSKVPFELYEGQSELCVQTTPNLLANSSLKSEISFPLEEISLAKSVLKVI